MTEFIGLAYFAEIPVTIIDVQRGGPSTGMPTRTQQADLLSCAYASHGDTKHVLLFPEDPRECFDFAAARARPRRPPADADLRDDRPRHRHEPPPVRAARVGRRAQLRPRQGDDAPRSSRPARTSAATSTSTATASRTARCPARIRASGAYFTRGTTRDAVRALLRGRPRLPLQRRAAAEEVRDRRRTLVPQPVLRKAAQRDALRRRSTSARPARRWPRRSTRCRRDGVHVDTLRVRAFPFSAAVDRFIAEHETVFVVEQNRDAQLRTMLVNEQEIDPARLEPILHYDGTPITARFIIEAIAERMRADNVEPIARRKQGAGRMTYLAKPKLHHPTLPTQQARLHAARLRRQDLDAVRRLRPRLDLGGDRPGLLGARHRAAPRRQALGHRLLVEDARLLPRRLARLQHRARPHAVGADRREPRQPRPALPRRQRRRRLGVDRPRPVRARDAARRAT